MAEVPATDPADVSVYEMPEANASVGYAEYAEDDAGAHGVEGSDLEAKDAGEAQDAGVMEERAGAEAQEADADAGADAGDAEAEEAEEAKEADDAEAEEVEEAEEAEEADDAEAEEVEEAEEAEEADDAEAEGAEEADDAEAEEAEEADDAEAEEAEEADDAEAEEAEEADDAEAEEAEEADDAEAEEADADNADADNADADNADAHNADADVEADDPDAEAKEAEAKADQANADELEAADDSSSLSDELPTVRLTFQGQDFAAFPTESQDSGPFVYVEGEEGSDELVRVSAPELRIPPATFWEPLDAFFAALRVKDALGEFLEDGTELCLSFPDLELDLMEDNVYARDITLHDISQLALGFGHQASLHVVVSEEVRFISRYNELAMRMNGAADEVDVSDAQDEPRDETLAAPADAPGATQQAAPDKYGDAALHDMYDMDDEAGEARPYDDADHAAYEDEPDSHARGKRAADEPDDEASKRARTAS
ncbi:hypothetical protein MCAP1_002556 [Malassezia caprae]|uniref:Uncharacterized protein n=1 Tax=Malassezia caprae TaxID=1381934 RepID=A0AAF0ED31_9BASI|nr:hypothetical protein MCAP1_002556 [Malassezia caprae]